MDLKRYEKLKKEVDVKSFEGKYGVLDKLLHVASFLGNIGSIFFAFFFINELLYNATTDFTGRVLILGTATVVSMGIFELLKRYVFRNLSLSILSKQSNAIELFYNIMFSLVLVSGSFYLSLNGAKEFADKSTAIESQASEHIIAQADSIKLVYSKKIDLKTDERHNVVKTRDIYVNKMASGKAYSSRLKEYNKLINDANAQLEKIDESILRIERERDSAISDVRLTISKNTDKQIQQVGSNKVAFLLISAFIELLILVGVYFHTFYMLKIFNDFKRRLVTSPSYGIYESYNKLLAILFKNGKVDVEEVLPDDESFIKMASARDDFEEDEIRDFLELCTNLGLTVPYRQKRIAAKRFDESKELLINYFNF